MNVKFTWYDAFTREKRQGGAGFEACCSLYNHAVCLMREACYKDLSGDGIKSASKLFMQAAWVFEELTNRTSALPAGEVSADMSKEALSMCSSLCLAQAQYLFYKKANDNKMKGNILAKICSQTSTYFQTAFNASQGNPALRSYEGGKFTNILGYHAKYFEAMSYWHQGEYAFVLTETECKGMGMAASILSATVAKFEACKQFAAACGGSYKTNFDTKLAAAIELRDKAIHQNKAVYYETIVPVDQVAKPDCQNFVNLQSVLDELNHVPDLDKKLCHLVPPAVRQMNDELKNVLQGIVTEEFNKATQLDEQLNKFLAQFGLPQSLQALSATQDIPDTVWQRVEGFQKKGSAQNFVDALAAVKTNAQRNKDLVGQCE